MLVPRPGGAGLHALAIKQVALVELLGGELGDGRVHAVLLVQHLHSRAPLLVKALAMQISTNAGDGEVVGCMRYCLLGI